MQFSQNFIFNLIRTLLFLCLFLQQLDISSQNKFVIDESNSPYFISNDTTILVGDTLIIGPGAEVFVSDGVNIQVKGSILINGTVSKRAFIKPVNPQIGWGVLNINRSVDTFTIKNAVIEEGRIVSSQTVNYFENTTFINHQDLEWNHAISRFVKGEVYIKGCFVYGINKGEGFLCHDIDSPIVSNNYFKSIPDAIELIDSEGGRISKCQFIDIRDDAIDLNNCNGVLIDSNIIINAFDRGMEIGSENNGRSTNIHLYRNVVVKCKSGINFKNGSTGFIENNTIVGNQNGISLLTDNFSNIGSYVDVINCIFDQNTTPILNELNSAYSISYSSSSSLLFDGEANKRIDPQFKDPENFDFHLHPFSGCIDKGAINGKVDLDGTVIDMGAHYFHQQQALPILNEILIGPNPTNEFITIRSNYSIEQIQIFDSKGMLKLERNVSIGKENNYFKLEVSYLDIGNYILILKGINLNEKRKIVIY